MFGADVDVVDADGTWPVLAMVLCSPARGITGSLRAEAARVAVGAGRAGARTVPDQLPMRFGSQSTIPGHTETITMTPRWLA